jgi:two-component system sensor histidine kinase UhpB
MIRNVERVMSVHVIQNLSEEVMDLLSEKQQVAVYRIIEEQLQNIMKHAFATQLSLNLWHNRESVILHIADNGRGFEPSKKHEGIGFSNIRNRVELLQGTMSVESAPGEGVRLTVEFPM